MGDADISKLRRDDVTYVLQGELMAMGAVESKRYGGVVVPMVSAFTEGELVDAAAAGRIVDLLMSARHDGVFTLGTTGESASISVDEKRKLVQTITEHTAGRATVYAGIASNSLRESIDAAKAYKGYGADVAVAHPPSYYPINNRMIENYFLRLADSIPLPVVLYNIPVTTHHSIAIDVVERLRHHPNIVAIKDSSGDAKRLAEMLAMTGGRGGFPVLLGASPIFTAGLKAGAAGMVPSGGHLVPVEYQQMYEAAMACRWDDVERLQKETDAVCSQYAGGGVLLSESIAKLKKILATRGLCGATVLPPLMTLK